MGPQKGMLGNAVQTLKTHGDSSITNFFTNKTDRIKSEETSIDVKEASGHVLLQLLWLT